MGRGKLANTSADARHSCSVSCSTPSPTVWTPHTSPLAFPTHPRSDAQLKFVGLNWAVADERKMRSSFARETHHFGAGGLRAGRCGAQEQAGGAKGRFGFLLH